MSNLHACSRAGYEGIADPGGLAPYSRAAPLDGEIIDMSPQEGAHATAAGLAEDVLRRCLADGLHGRGKKPLAPDDRSEPEPDAAVVPDRQGNGLREKRGP